MTGSPLVKLARGVLQKVRALQEEDSPESEMLEKYNQYKEIRELLDATPTQKVAKFVVEAPFTAAGVDVGKKTHHFWRGFGMGLTSMGFTAVSAVAYPFNKQEAKEIFDIAVEIGCRASDEYFESSLLSK